MARKYLFRYLTIFFAASSHAFLSSSAMAKNFCFAVATSYYEQIYCELQFKGRSGSLPPLHEFKRSHQPIQYSLLKRPAAAAGIKLEQQRNTPDRDKTPVLTLPEPSLSVASFQSQTSTGETLCDFSQGSRVVCPDRVYRLQGNRHNRHLAETSLTSANTMNLPVFESHNATAVYRHYLLKMHEIGLAGVTMNFEKFCWLYEDLSAKSVDVNQRFEVMYDYLKRDKKAMAISESIVPDADVQARDCQWFADDVLVCYRNGRNYLYLSESDSELSFR